MSGHSHYATIKRQKESNDAAKGKIFSKLARAIQIAVKTGGSPDPDANYKLRMAVDTAKSANMPKGNIERAIIRASGEGGEMDEVSYEGFGPGGVGIIIETVTDNRNRTGQEMKNLFERGGGNLAGPGAVSFNFERKGQILVRKEMDSSAQMLKLIDLGVEDIDEVEDSIEVYISPEQLASEKNKLSENRFNVISSSIVMRPKTMIDVNSKETAQKVLKLLDLFEDNDDVQKVYANLNIPDEIFKSIKDQ